MNRTKIKAQSGFTLIELMVTTIILTIIISVGVPGLRSLFTKQNIHSTGTLFARSIQFARTEAIKKGVNIDVIPVSGTADWSQGWTVEDLTTPDIHPLIRVFEDLPGSPTFTSTLRDGAAATTTTLVLKPNGQSETTGSFTMFYPDCSGNNVLTYTLLISGVLKKTVSRC
mgnify:CR=1 FL=1